MRDWKFYIDTYGCKVNQYESESIAEAWHSLGGEKCDDPRKADYILVNSCAITSRAERDARNAVFRFKREAPQAKVILSGCAAQFFYDFRPRKNANWAAPDFCLPQKEKTALLLGPEAKYKNSKLPLDLDIEEFSIVSYNRGRPVIKIQDGCSQNCSYCIVPQSRGKPVSADPEKILREMRILLEAGYRELIISGINLRQYGKDRPEYGDFWHLLHFLDNTLFPLYPGARLRISSLEPAQLRPENLDILLSLNMVCPHIHLSLQHASPYILKKMGRGHYGCEHILAAIQKIKAKRPVFGLGADIIAGFPGETEDDLRFLLDFIDKIPLTYAHVFPFSARQGTVAKNLPDQLTLKEKCRRAAVIRQKIALKNRDFLHSLLDMDSMLVAPDLLTKNEIARGRRGINEFYAPCYFNVDKSLSSMGLIKAKAVAVSERGLEVVELSAE